MISKIKKFFERNFLEFKKAAKIWKQEDLIDAINSFIVANELAPNENLTWFDIKNGRYSSKNKLAKVEFLDNGDYRFECSFYFYNAGLQIKIADYDRLKTKGTTIFIAIRRHTKTQLTRRFIEVVEAQFGKQVNLDYQGDVYAEYMAQVDGNYKEIIEVFNILMIEIEILGD